MKKRAKYVLGDVFSISTKKGVAYIQYTHDNDIQGEVIRVLQGVYKSGKPNLSKEVQRQERFFIFFPVIAAARRGLVKFVGNYPIPKNAKPFPMFRISGPDLSNKGKEIWWLWDGKKEVRIENFSDDMKSIPIGDICNYKWLVESIETNWKPELET